MENAKPFYLTGYILLSLGILFFALFKVFTTLHPAWLGVIIATGVYPAYVARTLAGKTKKPINAKLWNVSLITALALGLTLISSWPLIGKSILPSALIVFEIAMYLVYLFWYSKIEKKEPSIHVGEQLPMFTLDDAHRNTFTSMTLFNTPSIIVFYRGNWCPFCVSQVSELASRYKEFRERGIKVVFISPQPRSKIKQLSERFMATNTFLYDRDAKLAREWNVYSERTLPAGLKYLGYKVDTVLPTVIITDKNRRITHIDQTDNYRLRPLVDDLIFRVDKQRSKY